jgi:Rieske Fe-S protein
MSRRRKRGVNRQLDALASERPLPSDPGADPDDIDELRAAIALRAARPLADLPSADFVAVLGRRLRAETEAVASEGISRRALLVGAGAAAAAATAAGLAGVVVDRSVLGDPSRRSQRQMPASGAPQELEPDVGEWQTITSQTELAAAGGVQRFSTPSMVGFVSAHGDSVIAVSGACTHLGCLLRENSDANRLDCPCHRTSFGYDGRVLFSQLDTQPAMLPRVRARSNGDAIQVLIPPEV